MQKPANQMVAGPESATKKQKRDGLSKNPVRSLKVFLRPAQPAHGRTVKFLLYRHQRVRMLLS